MALSYTFSISYQTGCYRHIRISADAKLSMLHGAIADAFGLKDGRMHVFFMNNCAWDNTCGYYCTGFSESKNPATDEVRLCDFPLEKGTRFLYIYDFRNEQRFSIKLLRVSEEETNMPILVRSKGEFFLSDRQVKGSNHELPLQKEHAVPQDMWELVHLYASAAVNLYGFVSLPTFCKIFNGHNEAQIKLSETEEYLTAHAGEEYAVYNGFLVFPAGPDTPALLEDLLSEAHGKPRYVPDDRTSFLRYLDIYYTDTPEVTEKIKAYFTALYQDKGRAELATNEFLQMLKLDYPITEFTALFAAGDEAEEQRLFTLVIEAKNASRIWKNKGFTPLEAARLKISTPQVLKGVGRNDPCPCGSGKKYKKCCGR